MEHASEVLSIIEAGLEGNQKKAFAYADLLWHKLDDSDTLKKAIENRLSGAYKSMPTLQAMKSHYKNSLDKCGIMQSVNEPEQQYKNSEVCQKCANCCKQWWLYFTSEDEVTRFYWLDTDKIIVKKVREGLWKVTFDFPCMQLVMKDGKYYCEKYDSEDRPKFCGAYPSNFKEAEKEVLDLESKLCPIIKEVVKTCRQ